VTSVDSSAKNIPYFGGVCLGDLTVEDVVGDRIETTEDQLVLQPASSFDSESIGCLSVSLYLGSLIACILFF
jgi:hypothetical protein